MIASRYIYSLRYRQVSFCFCGCSASSINSPNPPQPGASTVSAGLSVGLPIGTLVSVQCRMLADRLLTSLQIQHHLYLAFTEGYKVREKPVTENIIESILSRTIDSLEPTLARQGYSVKDLADSIHVQPRVIRSFLKGKLPPGQQHEVQAELKAAGVPI